MTAEWKQLTPQDPLQPTPTYTNITRKLDVSGCTPGAVCTVSDVLPTAGMDNGNPRITFAVANADGLVGFVSRTVPVHNPKPTVSFISPQSGTALWGEVTISADAAPSTEPGAAPLEGVRFYVNGDASPGASYLLDQTPPYSVTLPATDIAPVLGSRYLVVVAEDTDGNLSLMPAAATAASARRRVIVGPPPHVAWTSPQTSGTITGSMRRGVSLEFHAACRPGPGPAPARPDTISDPFIDSYTVTLDGTPVGTARYGQAGWNGGPGGQKLRAIDGYPSPTTAPHRPTAPSGSSGATPTTCTGRRWPSARPTRTAPCTTAPGPAPTATSGYAARRSAEHSAPGSAPRNRSSSR